MADNNINIILEAIDKASPVLDKFKNNFTKTADQVSSKSKDMNAATGGVFDQLKGNISEISGAGAAGFGGLIDTLAAIGAGWAVGSGAAGRFVEKLTAVQQAGFETGASLLYMYDNYAEAAAKGADAAKAYFNSLSAGDKELTRNAVFLHENAAGWAKLEEEVTKLADQEIEADKLFNRIGVAAANAVPKIAGLAAAIAALGAAGLAIGLKGFEMVDKLADAGNKFGYTATQMMFMSQAAKDAAGSFEGVIGTYSKVAAAMVKAEDDTNKTAEAFSRLGIETTNANGELKTASEVALEVAQAIKTAQEEGTLSAQKMADARTVAGKSIIEEKEAIIAVAEAYQRANEAYEQGIGITKESIAAANEFEAASANMSNIWTVISSQFAQMVLPLFSALKDALVESYKSGGLVAGVFGLIKGATFVLVSALSGLFQVISSLGFGFVALTKAAVGLFVGMESAISAPWGKKLQAFKDGFNIAAEDIKKDAAEVEASMARMRAAINMGTGTLEKPTSPETSAPPGEGGGKKGPSETETFLKNLKKTADTFNMTTREKTLYDAATIAATLSDKKQAAAFMASASALAKKVEQLEFAKAAAEEANKLADEAIKKDEEERLKIEETVKSLRLKVEQQEFENTLVGLSNEEREKAILLRELEAAKIDVQSSSLQQLVERYKQANIVKREQKTIEDILKNTEDGKIDAQREQLLLMKRQFEQGKITEAQWIQSTDVILGRSKDAANNVSEQWVNAAKNMQNAMSTFFFDMMQGKMTNLADSFKKMLDKMVAEMLASQVASLLFGDITSSGKKATDTGLVGAAAGWLSSNVPVLFRAGGGGVNAGNPYVVGEVGPELFVPNSSGTIIPAAKTAGMMGGSNSLTVQVTAMDSQDVLRAMDKIKRPLAEMMNGTNRTYNLGGR